MNSFGTRGRTNFAPKGVHDGTLFPSNVIIVPMPSLGVDRLPNTTQHAEGTEIVTFNVLRAHPAQQPNCRRSSVELGNLMLLHGLPVAGGGGIYWC